jgi:hypothetical protein
LNKVELRDIIELYEGKVKDAGRFVVWVKSVKKFGEEWKVVEGTEVVDADVDEFKNGLMFAKGASSKK